MAQQDTISLSFTRAYNDLYALYEADQLDECLEGAENLLREPALPRYHTIKVQLLIASMLPDVDEAWSMHAQAEMLWQVVRMGNPQGQDAEIDATMADLWETVEAIKRELLIELGEKYDDVPPEEHIADRESRIKAELELRDERIAESRADDEALELADMKALGMTREEMLAKSASKKAANNNTKKPVIFGPTAATTTTSLSSSTATDMTGSALPIAPSVSADSSSTRLQYIQEQAKAAGYGGTADKPSVKGQAMLDASVALGFGGGGPYKNPMLKKPEAEVSKKEEGGHAPVFARARSMRKKTGGSGLAKRSSVASLKALFDNPLASRNAPPPVLDKYKVETMQDEVDEDDKETGEGKGKSK
ncbi:hypothetical protein B0A48_17384 [Cryoendolithus antarcticus]|uniref:Uncharacterized protein n=1 Tax=Cryoendolithus antarcticus TaxID=1507870 RepID=A0A1V8SC99_9PEZI|nr:hypothetical protein B0A48_17384 [Cryoendolithus antarcticus]